MLNRVKYKIFIKNPILDEVKLEFPELMILLKLVMSKIELKYNLSKISEDEIAYLTVYFQSAIEEVINKKSVIIVCSSGIGTSHLLEKRIKNYFPEWNIVDVVSAKQLETVLSLKDVDLVISTVHLQIPIDKPVAYVSALFNKTDERRIRESFIKKIPIENEVNSLNTIKLLERKNLNSIIKNSIFFKNIQIESIININIYENNNLKTEIFLKDDIESDKYNIDIFINNKNISNDKIKILYNWIIFDRGDFMNIEEVLSENLIVLDMKASNKEEAIRELAEILYKEGKISDKELFVKDVYLREAEGQTGLGNHIAIPHGKSDAVQVTSIVFGRTTNNLLWESPDDKPVHAVILFAVRNVDKTTVHLKLLSQVAMALADDETLEKLLTTQDKKEIIRLLSQEME